VLAISGERMKTSVFVRKLTAWWSCYACYWNVLWYLIVVAFLHYYFEPLQQSLFLLHACYLMQQMRYFDLGFHHFYWLFLHFYRWLEYWRYSDSSVNKISSVRPMSSFSLFLKLKCAYMSCRCHLFQCWEVIF